MCMIMFLYNLYIFCLIFSIQYLYCEAKEHFHQAADTHKLHPGWQEPGLWRPKWIMDRTFDETDEHDEYSDRIVFRLKSDRTMKIYSQKSRPKVEILKPRVEKERKKKLFESGEESSTSIEDQWEKAKVDRSDTIDGSWTWQDFSPLPQAIVRLETREDEERIRHDVRLDWGKLDGYAAKFRSGKILKYKMTDAGVPIGTYPIGTCSIRVSVHRPLVSKEYVAFQ